jgi:hypothetical protein
MEEEGNYKIIRTLFSVEREQATTYTDKICL